MSPDLGTGWWLGNSEAGKKELENVKTIGIAIGGLVAGVVNDKSKQSVPMLYVWRRQQHKRLNVYGLSHNLVSA